MNTVDRPPEAEAVEGRCRIVLFVPASESSVEGVKAALSGGDIASVILLKGAMSEGAFLGHATVMTAVVQAAGAAFIVEADSQAMGRAGADGLFLSTDRSAVADAVARFSPKRIVGCGNIKNRHQAMEAGEAGADFVFIGKTDGDIRPEAHPKNLKLGGWCAEVMQISVIAMGGNDVESVIEVAQSGVEFVGLSRAVFDHKDGPGEAVRQANALLDAHAPRFEDDEA